jgi:Chalcone isomerase-like
MKKKILVLLLIVFINSFNLFSQKAGEVDGVNIPRVIKFDNREITLNGVGSRTKLWIDVYTLALYLTKPSQNAKEILESNSAMGMIFFINSSLINSKNFSKNVSKGLRNSAGEALWLKFKPELDLLDEFVNSDEIVKNDVFNLVYNDHDSSIWVIKNGILKGKIPGFEFKKALFGIWLSEKPIKESLKNELLGLNQKS